MIDEPETQQEILHTPVERTADGGLAPVPARTGGAMIDLLEDGQFGVDLNLVLGEAGQAIHEHSQRTGQKASGTVTIKLKLEKDGDAFRIEPSVESKLPKVARPRSTMWMDRDNNFTRFPPGQMGMFSKMRSV